MGSHLDTDSFSGGYVLKPSSSLPLRSGPSPYTPAGISSLYFVLGESLLVGRSTSTRARSHASFVPVTQPLIASFSPSSCQRSSGSCSSEIVLPPPRSSITPASFLASTGWLKRSTIGESSNQ